MTSAFVTGGSGFVGGALIERLRGEGWEVRALARSERAAERVRELGAEPVMGDLDDLHIEDCEVAFHAAAKVEDFGDPADFERINVQGTRNVVAACRAGGVRRLVHVGTEAALMAGQPLVNVLLPQMVEMVRAGRFRWVGGGRQLTATTHIDNTVEGLWLAATKAPAGGVYFVTDGEPTVFRDFITEWVGTQGVSIPDKSVPPGVARAAAASAERIWRLLKRPGSPPLTRFAVWVSSQECTIDISRAERELGYVPVRTREDGLRELSSSPPG
jgi:nucleoside-diphosphate-sugar epimerase